MHHIFKPDHAWDCATKWQWCNFDYLKKKKKKKKCSTFSQCNPLWWEPRLSERNDVTMWSAAMGNPIWKINIWQATALFLKKKNHDLLDDNNQPFDWKELKRQPCEARGREVDPDEKTKAGLKAGVKGPKREHQGQKGNGTGSAAGGGGGGRRTVSVLQSPIPFPLTHPSTPVSFPLRVFLPVIPDSRLPPHEPLVKSFHPLLSASFICGLAGQHH